MTPFPYILSTKILNHTQKALLLDANIAFEENPFINIEYLPLDKNLETQHAIFSSQNAVKAILKNNIKINNAYCVGEKTAALLHQSQIHVKDVTSDSKSLGELLISKYPKTTFTFYCGSMRLYTIPDILRKNQVSFKEVKIYKTILKPKMYNKRFDAVLFFSPSAIESFVMKNPFESIAFCIGGTSEKTASKYFKNIITAPQATIESTINQVINHFK